ncbi:MAG: tRNA lysidine(34) synthetase TilS [Cyclobacteriaceae bacterium]|nr:tRNA lysidine(34) synthetase TilS [Cyclobacteriaceae bacterium]
MLEQFLNHIDRHKLCSQQDRVLLAVSGGLDSMVMLDLFVNAGFNIGLAHCNFQLRGNDSDEDERFVREKAEALRVPFFTTRFKTKSFADEQGISIQMAARELRYAWFDEIMDQGRFTKLATAHHINDAIETSLLNWTKGNLFTSGIPVKNNRVIRPLLFATRAELEQYASQHGILWREDVSNATTDYERNFIRHRVLPLLKEINPSLEQTILRGWTKQAGSIELAEENFNQWKNEFITHKGHNLVIPKRAFNEYTNKASLLWHLIQHLGFHFDVCEQIVEALNGQPGKKFEGGGYELIVDRDALILSGTVSHWGYVKIQKDHHQIQLGSWNLKLERISLEEARNQLVKKMNKNVALLDADAVSFPLVWRQWQAGDAFLPLGMSQQKKVSDLLIDEKVNRADKNRVTVLLAGGEIVWVVGHRIDNRFKITDKTRHVLRLTVYP